ATDGAPQTLSDRGASVLWDGGRLPGPWLVTQAIDTLIPRAREYGCATLVIRRSHHIACLASYLLRAIEADMLMVLSCSDPAGRSVAPFGGTRAVFTPNPIAVGIPASSPILVDISASLTTNGMSTRVAKQGKSFDEAWFMDADGRPTCDPKVLFEAEPGTILPIGGLAAGHKGYGLALLIEALTGGLAGRGRADHEQGWGATVFISLYDTLAFGGKDDFRRQMDWIAAACRANPPRPGVSSVRMPGDRGLAQRADQLHHGVRLHDGILPALAQCAARYGISLPPQKGQ
ncbi:MAG TPA: Ldh family oxidoreductase, partial [Burkholderiaceae bacterium]|nr:Ldh family oxidoreductase [Burkholderiaceae bacterium]